MVVAAPFVRVVELPIWLPSNRATGRFASLLDFGRCFEISRPKDLPKRPAGSGSGSGSGCGSGSSSSNGCACSRGSNGSSLSS